MNSVAHAPPPAAPDDLPDWPPDRIWGLAPAVAAALGCHRQTVYKMARAGILPARPHGLHGWRFHRDDVLRLLRAQGSVPPAPRPEPGPLARVLGLLDDLSGAELLAVIETAARRAGRS